VTIAQLNGASAGMTEKHYGKLAKDAALKTLGELAL
jgi:hypothetical protein